jgi:hypothetical protein
MINQINSNMEVIRMKTKIVILTVALGMLFTTAYGADHTVDNSVVKGFHATNGVTLKGVVNGAGDAWATLAVHSKGDKEYGTTSAFGGLYYKTVDPGSTAGTPAAPATSTDSTVPSGYTTL